MSTRPPEAPNEGIQFPETRTCPHCARTASLFPEEFCPFCAAVKLADWHAATAEYDGNLKSMSRRRKERLISICEKAASLIKFREDPNHSSRDHRHISDIQKRCEAAAKVTYLEVEKT